MQERKKYKMTLTQAQAEKMQQLINMTSFANDVKFEEIPEVKAEVDEREEALKFFTCGSKECFNHECDSCCYDHDIAAKRAKQIALKHIQGYKNTMEWLQGKIEKGIVEIWDWDITYERAIIDTIRYMEKEFDISEVK